MPPNQKLRGVVGLLQSISPPLEKPLVDGIDVSQDTRLRCAVLGCGMMGQEHVSYICGYPQDVRIDFLCDPHAPSLAECMQVLHKFSQAARTSPNGKDCHPEQLPLLLSTEDELFQHARRIDLLVIATPNYLHADTLMRWGQFEHLTILLEKPAAVSREQHDRLLASSLAASVWVAMEYRFIPAIAKLVDLLPTIGDIQMCTIRENRFPFLHKIGRWNRDPQKTGDTLVEKCCHFFDLMRLLTGQEANLDHVRAIAQRGINYQDEAGNEKNEPIIDAAYVFMSFLKNTNTSRPSKTIGCLELCMYADGSRHQEEIVVTGTKGRLEAYLPENKVYAYERPSHKEWTDRSKPPPVTKEVIYDCSNVGEVHQIDDMPSNPHGGYHYCSTAVEWYRLLAAIREHAQTGEWKPQVSLMDGLRAVDIGLEATHAIVNEVD